MIVHCPSCQTRYRHSPAPQVAATTAHCSQCDEGFPLDTPKRSYVLVPMRGPAGKPLAIGMDDPTLAARIEGTTMEPPADVEITTQEPEASTTAGTQTGRSGWVDVFAAFAPAAVAGVVAYSLAGRQNADPIAWAAAGGALGLLAGWGVLLWVRRED